MLDIHPGLLASCLALPVCVHQGSAVEPPHDGAVHSRACLSMRLCVHRRSAPRRSAHTAAGCWLCRTGTA